MLPLIARSTQSKGQVFLGCGSAFLAAFVLHRPLRGLMCHPVLTRSQQYKILNAVILRVLVFVMNVLPRKGAHEKTVFILPFIRLSSLHKYVEQPISSFVQSLASYWLSYSICLQRISLGFQYDWVKRFSGAARASRRIMVRIAVSPLFAHNSSAAKGTWFCKEALHGASLYQAY